MRRLRIDDPSVDGAVLVRDVHAPGGEVLARAGMTLTPRALRALGEHGVALCFVEDAPSQGLAAAPLVDPTGADLPVLRALRDACAVIWRFAEGPARHSTTRAVEEIRDLRIIGALDGAGATEALRAAVAPFAARAATADGSAGFLTDRQATDDLYGHALGVAALAVRIGADIGFQQRDLQTAALAALMHDVGLLLVPDEVRRTPAARRTAGQQRRYEDHTVLGHAVLKPLDRRDPALPVVALEHHEEQGGGGYPHGMTGGNRVLRSAQPGAPRRISLISEIVAVADRYERLVSPAPGERPLSPAAARRILAAEAGARLNAEVVGRFLDLLPQWPLGTEVLLRGGAWDGSRAGHPPGSGPRRAPGGQGIRRPPRSPGDAGGGPPGGGACGRAVRRGRGRRGLVAAAPPVMPPAAAGAPAVPRCPRPGRPAAAVGAPAGGRAPRRAGRTRPRRRRRAPSVPPRRPRGCGWRR